MAESRRFGWHSGKLICKDIEVRDSLTIKGTFVFGDAATDNLTVNGAATFNQGLTIGSGKTVTWNSDMTQSSVGSAGSADALPSNPEGYLKIKIGTTTYVVPYYKQA